MGIKKRVARVAELPLLALRGLVIFPGMLLHFDVGRKKSMLAPNEAMTGDQLIYLVAQTDIADDDPGQDGLFNVGVVAKVRQVLKMPGETLRVMVEGLYRAKVREFTGEDPFYLVRVHEMLERPIAETLRAQALLRECRTYFEQYAELAGKMPADVLTGVAAATDVGYLADYIASNTPMPAEEKQRILSSASVEKRVELLLTLLARETDILELEQDIQEQVHESIDRNQREYYLREQMRAIAAELGDGDNPLEEADELRDKIGVVYGNPETTTGGNALKFYASVRIDIRRMSVIKDGEDQLGTRTKVKVVKNKVAPPFKRAEFDIMFGEGISKIGEIVDLGVDYGVVKKAGSWFSYGDRKIGQGRDAVKELLKNDEELRNEIEAKVREAMKTTKKE